MRVPGFRTCGLCEKNMKGKAYNNMKKKESKEEMSNEYSFKDGTRGKHFKQYRQGHEVRVFNENGTIKIEKYTLADGAVMLDPDVKRYFKDSNSVNNALRAIIKAMPHRHKV